MIEWWLHEKSLEVSLQQCMKNVISLVRFLTKLKSDLVYFLFHSDWKYFTSDFVWKLNIEKELSDTSFDRIWMPFDNVLCYVIWYGLEFQLVDAAEIFFRELNVLNPALFASLLHIIFSRLQSWYLCLSLW